MSVLDEEQQGSGSHPEGAGDGGAPGFGGSRQGATRPEGQAAPAGGRTAAAPAEVAAQTGRLLAEREAQWLDRLARDPASFAVVEREVHDQARHQADLYVAGLLAKASERPEMAAHVAAITAAAEAPLRPAEKKNARWWSAFWVGWRSR